MESLIRQKFETINSLCTFEILIDKHHAIVYECLLDVMWRLWWELIDVSGVEVVLLRSLMHHWMNTLHVRGLHIRMRLLSFGLILLVEM